MLRPDGAPRGVLVALHGADQEADDAAETWAAAADAGLVVVAVTSSRRSTPTYRTWPDQGAAAADVRIALETLPDGERELPVEVVDNLGHAYPPDLSDRLRTCQWQAWL